LFTSSWEREIGDVVRWRHAGGASCRVGWRGRAGNTFYGALIEECVGPFADCGLDEVFGLALGAWRIDARPHAMWGRRAALLMAAGDHEQGSADRDSLAAIPRECHRSENERFPSVPRRDCDSLVRAWTFTPGGDAATRCRCREYWLPRFERERGYNLFRRSRLTRLRDSQDLPHALSSTGAPLAEPTRRATMRLKY